MFSHITILAEPGEFFKSQNEKKIPQVLVYTDNLTKEISDKVNIIIIMGKYHIHSCKWKNQKPSLTWFIN